MRLNSRYEDDFDEVNIIGTISKEPRIRETPLGSTITELIVQVTYNGKSQYIPCIAWGNTAIKSNKIEKFSKISVLGRLQSRKYFKKSLESSSDGELKETYEVSIYIIKVI